MSFTEKGLTDGLAALKASLDETDSRIKAASEKADELKDFVRQYNQIKQEIAEMRKSRRATFQTLITITQFVQRVTGEFPDGMYPLFSQEAEASGASHS